MMPVVRLHAARRQGAPQDRRRRREAAGSRRGRSSRTTGKYFRAMRATHLLILALAPALGGNLGAETFPPGRFGDVLEKIRTSARIPGVSAAIVQDGRVVLERGFGFVNLEKRVRATPDTPYNIASVSK